MSSIPKISVIICAYNRANLLPIALESALMQTFADLELIVLDDASKEDIKSVLPHDPRIVYIRNEKNRGIAKSRNRALDAARGEFVAVLDSDDFWTDREKLATQLAYLDEHPHISAVGTWAEIIDREGDPKGEIVNASDPKEIYRDMLRRNPLVHSSVLYRKAAALKAGGYDESLAIWEDYGLWLKMNAQKGSKTHPVIANISEKMVAYRRHSHQSDSGIRAKAAFENLKLVFRYRKSYPGRVSGILKGIARTGVALFR